MLSSLPRPPGRSSRGARGERGGKSWAPTARARGSGFRGVRAERDFNTRMVPSFSLLCVSLRENFFSPTRPRLSRAEIAGSAEGRRKSRRACGAGEWGGCSWVFRSGGWARRMPSFSLLCVLRVLCAKISSPPTAQEFSRGDRWERRGKREELARLRRGGTGELRTALVWALRSPLALREALFFSPHPGGRDARRYQRGLFDTDRSCCVSHLALDPWRSVDFVVSHSGTRRGRSSFGHGRWRLCRDGSWRSGNDIMVCVRREARAGPRPG